MRLPNAERAIVDPTKITEYLLNLSHPDGASKARFFGRFGFSLDRWENLAKSLRDHAMRHTVESVTESEYGLRYCIDGLLETPDGRKPRVRTVWLVTQPGAVPRLITAHPRCGGDHDQGA